MNTYNELEKLLTKLKIDFKVNELLSRHTSFKIGGACRLMILPKSEMEVSEIMSAIKAAEKINNEKITALILGNGSNILASDDGFDGVVILFGNNFSQIVIQNETNICASAGVSLVKLCHFAAENSLTGLEWAYGIPAAVGGAVYMNAGAYGGEMKDVVLNVRCMNDLAQIKMLYKSDFDYSYRHSAFMNANLCILSAVFALQKGDKEEIKSRMNEMMQRRTSKQPIEFPSAGSTFKRPQGAYAAKLIEDCALKGTRIGGAQVSEKHSGFIINVDNASCKDVKALINKVRDTVYEKSGISLECEVKFVGVD